MKKHIIPVLAIIAVLTMNFVACTPNQSIPNEPTPSTPTPTEPTNPTVPPQPVEKDPVKIGFIGSFAADYGKCTQRGAELAIQEINDAGGILGGRPIELVKADAGENVTEAIKAYDYLNEVEDVDFIISGTTDDQSVGWFERMAEYRTPTVDTWTTSFLLIQQVTEEYEKYKMYFMKPANDWLVGSLYADFAKDVLHDELGWDTCVLLREDTGFGAAIGDWIAAEILTYAGVELLDDIVYDVETIDFSPIYHDITETDPDFIYQVASINCVVPTAQYVELQVPVPMTGINVAAYSYEYWEDTGGMGAGISTMVGPPSIGLDYDPRTQAFVDKWLSTYDTRPKFPHFNGFHAYYGVYEAVEAAQRVYDAGLGSGFEPLDEWVREMENTDYILERDGEVWFHNKYYKQGDIEPLTGMEWVHGSVFDPAGIDGNVSMTVLQWYQDGTVKCIYPPKYANGEIAFPAWIPADKLPASMQ